MSDPRPHLTLIIACFPDQGARIRELFLADLSFRGLCEEYGLARACLNRFETLGEASRGAEVEDYRSVIAALEAEIVRFVTRSPDGRWRI